MPLTDSIIHLSIQKPKLITTIMVLGTLLIGALILRVHVDTDPEHIPIGDTLARVFHNQTKKDFSLNDVVVLGIVNNKDPDGVFNPATLAKIDALSKFAATLEDPDDPGRRVVERHIIAPDNVDNILPAGQGHVRFEWLMQHPPVTREAARQIRDAALDNPLLKGTMISEDGRSLALYLPITSKDFANYVSQALHNKIKELGTGDDRFYITGLPVAEATLGKDMFIQMAIFAPMALGIIFLLMFFFFRKVQLIISPLIIAACTVIATMGLLIGTGNTLHTMSCMIPIFILPIAVLDSMHILSAFFEAYPNRQDRQATILHVMKQLTRPILFTSLTSAAGFASLAFTPLPPVQTFGLFVAIGIMLAWGLTISFMPAYIMLIKEENLENFGSKAGHTVTGDNSLLQRHLRWIGKTSLSKPWLVIGFNMIIMAMAIVGFSRVQINDNPIKWLKKTHEIRRADKVLNQHFGGTYEAYLVLTGNDKEMTPQETADWLTQYIEGRLAESPAIKEKILNEILEAIATSTTGTGLTDKLSIAWGNELDRVPADDDIAYDRWSTALDGLDRLRNRKAIFKTPEVLNYIADLQTFLRQQGDVGKANAITDVVKKVHKELFSGDQGYFTIPDTITGVAQTLTWYQKSHKPDDLWHLVTPDYSRANIRLQLKSGDNADMKRLVTDVKQYMANNPPPNKLSVKWAGLTYLNLVRQDKMVKGILKSFLSSFIVVFIMMSLLFKSPIWGLLAMIPLTCTTGLIYGVTGLIGIDCDMPMAILSLLSLGLAVDFAIHFLQRVRMTMAETGEWNRAITDMFKEPARAFMRNIIVVAVGFTPFLLSTLIPYQKAGMFQAAITLYAGMVTLWLLPALLTVMRGWIFQKEIKAHTQQNKGTVTKQR